MCYSGQKLHLAITQHPISWPTPDPSPLHPTPRTTPSPHPCTINAAPYALHPTPYTLHPTPYTLHPPPQTLHLTPRPEPWTRHEQASFDTQECGFCEYTIECVLLLMCSLTHSQTLSSKAKPLNPTPSTLNPQPERKPQPQTRAAHSTLNPKAYIPHPTPHTLHPTPYTLHPTPYTLHPTPQTLHLTPRPEPWTRHEQASFDTQECGFCEYTIECVLLP